MNANLDNIVIATIGNWGYRDMILNWWLNIKCNVPELIEHVVVIVYEDELESYLKRNLPIIKTHKINYDAGKNYRDPVAYKKDGWDVVTRFKLMGVWYFISQGKDVIYLDPDVVLFTNVVDDMRKKSTNERKILIQQGKPFCSGVMYIPNSEASRVAFNPKTWEKWNSDDEKYIIHHFEKPKKIKRMSGTIDWSNSIDILPLCEYPNGLFTENVWSMEVTDVKQMLNNHNSKLLHFNYISGLDKKCAHIKRFGYWKKPLRIVNVPSYLQPQLSDVCIAKTKSNYPPHQEGPQIETYFNEYLNNRLKSDVLYSDYDYIPIYWTAIAVKNDNLLKEQTRQWVRQYVNNNPNTKCFTIVQHCKSIEGALNLILPKEWTIFSTSNPNYSKDILKTLENNIYIHANTQNLPVCKIKQLNNPQPLHGMGRPNIKQPNRFTQSLIERKKLHAAKQSKFDIKNHHVIPLLCSPHLKSPIKGSGVRKYLASFIGNINIHPVRKEMERILIKQDGIIIKDGKYINQKDVNNFGELMLNSTFALCPRGFGNSSFRLIEAMEYGAIPIYISDYHSLPFENDINWEECSLIYKPDELHLLHNKLNEIVNDESMLSKLQSNVYEVYCKYLTFEKCSEHILGRCLF